MSEYGYITWRRGVAKWRPDKISANDAWFPNRPTKIEEITNKQMAEKWWDAVYEYFLSRPSPSVRE